MEKLLEKISKILGEKAGTYCIMVLVLVINVLRKILNQILKLSLNEALEMPHFTPAPKGCMQWAKLGV